MYIHLPIAGSVVNSLYLIAVGGFGGFFSGISGLGSACFVVPTLVSLGIGSKFAVASAVILNLISSFVNYRLCKSEGKIDFHFSALSLCGVIIGMVLGVNILAYMNDYHVSDIVIPVLYLVVLSYLLIVLIRRIRSRDSMVEKLSRGQFFLRWPFMCHFSVSQVQASIILIVLFGAGTGLISGMIGIGGGIMMLPFMMYVICMDHRVAIGNAAYQTFWVSCIMTVLYSMKLQSVDILLSMIMGCGAFIGVNLGARIGRRVSQRSVQIMLICVLSFLLMKIGYKMIEYTFSDVMLV